VERETYLDEGLAIIIVEESMWLGAEVLIENAIEAGWSSLTTDGNELRGEAVLRGESLLEADCIVADKEAVDDDASFADTGVDGTKVIDVCTLTGADTEPVARGAEMEADRASMETAANTDEALPEELAEAINEEPAGTADEVLAMATDEALDDTKDDKLAGATDEALADATGVEDATLSIKALDDTKDDRLADATGVEDAATLVHPAGMLFCRLTTTGSFSKKAGYSTLRLLSVGPFKVRFALVLKAFVTFGA
jgi:hypothetical protein